MSTSPGSPDAARPSASYRSGLSDLIFSTVTTAAGLMILMLVASLVAVLLAQSWPVLSRAGEYQLFTSDRWIPKPADPDQLPTFGALPFIYGTVVTAVIAMLIAVPMGVATAAYLSEIASAPVRKVGAFLIELLAAIPSVIYGFWGLFFLAPQVQALFNLLGGPNTGGNGLLCAGLILAIMVLPYITSISFDVCQAVPRSQREGSLALGGTRWQTIWRVVLPYARPGIIAASFLALGRALGETMAVTMLIGNTAVIDFSIFGVGDTIASKIANSLNEADTQEIRAALIALGLVLLIVTGVFNLFARILLAQLSKPPKPTKSNLLQFPTGLEAQLPNPPAFLSVPKAHPEFWNKVMSVALRGAFILTIVPLFSILGLITYRGASSVEMRLFTERARPNLSNEQYDQYKAWKQGEAEYPLNEIEKPVRRGGLGHAMLGSLSMVGLATLFAVPIGLTAAVYLSESRRSKLASTIRFLTELLAGVPSIIIGIFAYAILVYPVWLPGTTWGFSGWAGAFALMVMMIPIVVRSAEESMRLVPESIRQASYALGATRMQTVVRVIVPAALPAIVTGIFLAVGRIAGETAPLLLTAGQYSFWPESPSREMPFLPGYIYSYSRSPYQDYQDQAWGGALVLLGVVMLVNVGIRLVAGKRQLAASRSD